MPVTYERADEDVEKIGGAMMKKYHGDMTEAGVKVDYIFASAERNEAGEVEANAVSSGGFECIGKTKIIGLKDRAAGRADMEILIDEDKWRDLTDPEKDAVIDTMLQRVELKRDDKNIVMTDDQGRPKLKAVRADYRLEGFSVCAERHFSAAVEVKQAKAFVDQYGQSYFGWQGKPSTDIETSMLPGVMHGKTLKQPEQPKPAKGKKGKNAPDGPVSADDAPPDSLAELQGRAKQPPKRETVKRETVVEFVAKDAVTPESLGLTKAAIEEARYPHILAALGSDRRPDIKAHVKIKDQPYIAMYPAVGEKADYRLVPVIPNGDFDPDADYSGGIVTFNGEQKMLGSAKESILVAV